MDEMGRIVPPSVYVSVSVSMYHIPIHSFHVYLSIHLIFSPFAGLSTSLPRVFSILRSIHQSIHIACASGSLSRVVLGFGVWIWSVGAGVLGGWVGGWLTCVSKNTVLYYLISLLPLSYSVPFRVSDIWPYFPLNISSVGFSGRALER